MEKRNGTFIVKISGLSKLKNIEKEQKPIRMCGGPAQLLDRPEVKKKNNFAESEKFTVGKTTWNIECIREDGRYCFYLGMLEEGDIEADYSITIMSKNPEVDDINENESSCERKLFDPENYKVLFSVISDISNFIVDDTMEFKVSIEIKRVAFIGCYEVDFSKPTKLSDIVLLVEGKEIHVNKQFLSMHSKVFEDMFSKNQETIFEIDDIDDSFECIIELCRLIYPGADLLATYWYLSYMLELAEKYDMPYVRNMVTELLMTEKTLVDEDEIESPFTKYLIADKHKLKELQNHMLNSMTKKDIIDIVIHDCRFIKLSDESKEIFRQRLLDDEKSPKIEEVEDYQKLDFSTQNKYSDVCLVIEGKKIYVNKQYLAIHSSFFEAMFFSNFKEKDQAEIELKDVDYNVFIAVLTLIDPQAQIRVQQKEIYNLLKMADRFDIQRVSYLCERFLMNCTDIDESEKMAIAEKYSLKKLKELMMKKREEIVNV